EALALADQYHDPHGVTRAFELAWAHSQVQLRHLQLSPEEIQLYGRLAAHVIYAGPALRAPQSILAANRQGQPGLWRLGVSGDYPVVLVRVGEPEEMELVRQLLQAHAYWRLHGLDVDLVILNEHPTSYLEEVQQQIQNLVRASDSHGLIDKPSGVFVRKAVNISDDDKVLLLTAARVVLAGGRGSLAAQVEGRERPLPLPPRLAVRPGTSGRGTGGEGRRVPSTKCPAPEAKVKGRSVLGTQYSVLRPLRPPPPSPAGRGERPSSSTTAPAASPRTAAST